MYCISIRPLDIPPTILSGVLYLKHAPGYSTYHYSWCIVSKNRPLDIPPTCTIIPGVLYLKQSPGYSTYLFPWCIVSKNRPPDIPPTIISGVIPDSNIRWPKVGPTSVQSSRRWPKRWPNLHCCLGCIWSKPLDIPPTIMPGVLYLKQTPCGCAIQDIDPKLLLKPNLVKSRLPITYSPMIQSLWNFAQSMAVILPCSVQN